MGTQLCILVLVLQGLLGYWYCRYWYCRYWYCCTILVVVGVVGVYGCNISHMYTPHFTLIRDMYDTATCYTAGRR